MWLGHEDNHRPHTTAEEKSEWNYISTFPCLHAVTGARGPAVGSNIALQVRRLRFRFFMVSFVTIIDINFPAAPWPRGRFRFWQKWILGILPGRSSGRCVWLTTFRQTCIDFLEIWEPQSPGSPQRLPRPVQGLLRLLFCYDKISNWALYLLCHYRCFCHC